MSTPAGFEDIKRKPGVTTKNGTEWEARLDRTPSAEWVTMFKKPNEFSSAFTPAGIQFSSTGTGEIAMTFRAHEDQVDEWLRWIDKWVSWANNNYRRHFDEQQRREERQSEEANKEVERIRKLNERFRNT